MAVPLARGDTRIPVDRVMATRVRRCGQGSCGVPAHRCEQVSRGRCCPVVGSHGVRAGWVGGGGGGGGGTSWLGGWGARAGGGERGGGVGGGVGGLGGWGGEWLGGEQHGGGEGAESGDAGGD